MPAKGTKKGQRTICKIDDCTSVCFGHGYCNKHYKRWRKCGDPLHVEQPKGVYEFCTVADCHRPHQAQGLCRSHYSRWFASGDWPESPLGESRNSKGIEGSCLRSGCDLPQRGSGYCPKHYGKLKAMFKYGITDYGMYDALFDIQNGCCAICQTPLDREDKHTHVDHCHKHIFVRGILCRGCNSGLGQFQDDPARLRAAADYIERFLAPWDIRA